MKSLLKPVFAAGLVLAAASPILAAPAAAQAIKGIGVADLNAAVVNSSAYKTSEQQRPVTYKAQLDQANARAAQIKAQLDPLVKKFETDRKAANPDQKSLEQQEKQGQQEVNTILQPVALSRAYVAEQITDILPKAVENAAKKKGVTLVLAPDELRYADPSYSIDDAVTAELNAQLPSAQLVPPAGWQPRQVREQQAAQGQGAQPSGPQTEGR